MNRIRRDGCRNKKKVSFIPTLSMAKTQEYRVIRYSWVLCSGFNPFLKSSKVCFSLNTSIKHTEFGNARFARNLLEQTVMKESARLSRLNEESDGHARPLHRKDLITLEADDLAVESVMNYRVEKIQIGFR